MKYWIKGDLRSYHIGVLQWCLSKHCPLTFTDETVRQIEQELKRRDGEGSDAI